MLAKEFYARCNDETRKLLQAYIISMYEMGTFDDDISDKYKIPLYDSNKWCVREVAIFLFIFFNTYFNTDLGKVITEHGNLNIQNFNVNKKIIHEMEDAYSNDNFEYYYELTFSNYNASASSIVKTYSNYDRTITLERIFVNMFDNGLFKRANRLCDLFRIDDELVAKVRKLAEEKEKFQPNENPFISSQVTDLPYGENLTKKDFAYNPLIGRDKEFRNMCANLLDEETSVILHGKHGVGKTALANGLAYRIQNGEAPQDFRNTTIVRMDASELISGCRLVGMVEERVISIIKSLLNKNAILFIDEIHTLMGLGQGEHENNDVSNILKPYLGDGRIKIIGATTTDEYNIILKNGAFARRFNGIEISVLDNTGVLRILEATIKRYYDTKGISFGASSEVERELLELIIEFTSKEYQNYFINKQLYNPDFALKVLRSGYNFARLDGKESVDIDSLVEGVSNIDFINGTAKSDFENRAKSLTRRKKGSRYDNIIDLGNIGS